MTSMARLPDWPRLLRRSLACAYVDMTPREFDAEVASGVLPDPVMGGRWDRRMIDAALDRMAGGGVADDWRAKVRQRLGAAA